MSEAFQSLYDVDGIRRSRLFDRRSAMIQEHRSLQGNPNHIYRGDIRGETPKPGLQILQKVAPSIPAQVSDAINGALVQPAIKDVLTVDNAKALKFGAKLAGGVNVVIAAITYHKAMMSEYEVESNTLKLMLLEQELREIDRVTAEENERDVVEEGNFSGIDEFGDSEFDNDDIEHNHTINSTYD